MYRDFELKYSCDKDNFSVWLWIFFISSNSSVSPLTKGELDNILCLHCNKDRKKRGMCTCMY